jgi:hypothetical protein
MKTVGFKKKTFPHKKWRSKKFAPSKPFLSNFVMDGNMSDQPTMPAFLAAKKWQICHFLEDLSYAISHFCRFFYV